MLQSEALQVLGSRADESQSLRLERGDELRVLAQEAVTRMDGLRPGLGHDPKQLVDVEVCLRNPSGAEGTRFARRVDVQRVTVRLGVDGHAVDSHRVEGPSDA